MKIRSFLLMLLIVILGFSCNNTSTSPENPINLPVINSFTVSLTDIERGESSTLSWNVSGATVVEIDNGIGTVSSSGKQAVAPNTTITFTLTASNDDGSVTQTAQIVVHGIYSQGNVTVQGTWSCDLDSGQQVSTFSNQADFRWEQISSTERYLSPQNGAMFYVVGDVDFSSIRYSDLTGYPYSSDNIDGSDPPNNQIPVGTVVASATNENRYCVFEIKVHGWTLTIRRKTYEL